MDSNLEHIMQHQFCSANLVIKKKKKRGRDFSNMDLQHSICMRHTSKRNRADWVGERFTQMKEQGRERKRKIQIRVKPALALHQKMSLKAAPGFSALITIEGCHVIAQSQSASLRQGTLLLLFKLTSKLDLQQKFQTMLAVLHVISEMSSNGPPCLRSLLKAISHL